MTYYFDAYGWLSPDPIPGRATEAVPPQESSGLRANWTGVEWVLAAYVRPPLPDTRPQQREVILARLGAIDADTGMSRTLRETFLALFDALGKPAPRFVADKETEAVALRAEIASEDIQEIIR